MSFYTIWVKGGNEPEATLLSHLPAYRSKHRAFKKARRIVNDVAGSTRDIVLVRKVKLGCDECIEWRFEATA